MSYSKTNKKIRNNTKKMHVLLIISLGILLATTAHAGGAGVYGCKGGAILDPPLYNIK